MTQNGFNHSGKFFFDSKTGNPEACVVIFVKLKEN